MKCPGAPGYDVAPLISPPSCWKRFFRYNMIYVPEESTSLISAPKSKIVIKKSVSRYGFSMFVTVTRKLLLFSPRSSMSVNRHVMSLAREGSCSSLRLATISPSPTLILSSTRQAFVSAPLFLHGVVCRASSSSSDQPSTSKGSHVATYVGGFI